MVYSKKLYHGGISIISIVASRIYSFLPQSAIAPPLIMIIANNSHFTVSNSPLRFSLFSGSWPNQDKHLRAAGHQHFKTLENHNMSKVGSKDKETYMRT